MAKRFLILNKTINEMKYHKTWADIFCYLRKIQFNSRTTKMCTWSTKFNMQTLIFIIRRCMTDILPICTSVWIVKKWVLWVLLILFSWPMRLQFVYLRHCFFEEKNQVVSLNLMKPILTTFNIFMRFGVIFVYCNNIFIQAVKNVFLLWLWD